MYFSGAGKFCLAHRLRELTRDVKDDVRTLNFRSDTPFHHREKHRMTFIKVVKCKKKKKRKKCRIINNTF